MVVARNWTGFACDSDGWPWRGRGVGAALSYNGENGVRFLDHKDRFIRSAGALAVAVATGRFSQGGGRLTAQRLPLPSNAAPT